MYREQLGAQVRPLLESPGCLYSPRPARCSLWMCFHQPSCHSVFLGPSFKSLHFLSLLQNLERNPEPDIKNIQAHIKDCGRCVYMWKPDDRLDHNPRSYELAPLLNLSRTVVLTFWKIHCCVSDSGSHLFMKIRLSPGLQSMQPLLTRWYKDLSFL